MEEVSSGSGELQPELWNHVGDDDAHGFSDVTLGVVGALVFLFLGAAICILFYKPPCYGYGHKEAKVAPGYRVVEGVPTASTFEDTRAVRLAKAAQQAFGSRACPGSSEALETMPLLRVGFSK